MSDATGADATDAGLVRDSLAVPELFAALFDRHAPAVHHYLARRVGELADDLLGETFLIAFRRRGSYLPIREDALPWLLGIATNLLRRHSRDERRRYRALARLDQPGTSPHADEDDTINRVDADTMRPRLAAALAALKPADREALLLVAWGGLTYTEVAAALAIPVGTVRSRLNRARQITRTHLGLDSIEDER